MGRRLLAVGLLALCFAAAAAAAPGVTATDPLQSQEWWLADVGADRAAPPGPGVPITIVDTGVDPTHPEFAARPDTTFLNEQSVFAGEEYHGTIVASVAAAPANGAGILGIYPTAALQVWDASSTLARHREHLGDRRDRRCSGPLPGRHQSQLRQRDA